MSSKFVTDTGTVDWDALTAKIAELQASNKQTISPTSSNLPAARTSTTAVPAGTRNSNNPFSGKFQGGTVTGTPLEVARVQEALKAGRSVEGAGTTEMTAWRGGEGEGLLPYGTTTSQLKYADQLIQMLEANGVGNAQDIVGGMLGTFGQQPQKLGALGTGIQDYLTQKQSFQKQSENYGMGTDIMASAVETSNKALTGIQESLTERRGGLSDAWDTALAKADEFVASAQERTKTVLSGLESKFNELNTDMSSAKAHAMQVAVQSAIGGMNGEGQVIARRYGTDSPEYEQHIQNKKSSLATMQSKIMDTYAQLGSNMSTQYLAGYAQTLSNTAMFENYNEQASLDIYKAAAAADQQYALDYSSQMAGIESLKMNNQTALAEWISATPVFSLSISSILSSVIDMQA
jgi:hypothetical protein